MIYTIGHSNHAFEDFVRLLQEHHIDSLIDVRSSPVSRFASQFDKDVLEKQLPSFTIGYIYKGDQLGGRPQDEALYDEQGYVLYGRVARSSNFERGVEWLFMNMPSSRMALMCAEENPALCHRHLLIARVLIEQGVDVQHIRGDGRLESYQQVIESERLARPQQAQADLFGSPRENEWKSLRSVLRENRPRPSSDY